MMKPFSRISNLIPTGRGKGYAYLSSTATILQGQPIGLLLALTYASNTDVNVYSGGFRPVSSIKTPKIFNRIK